MIVSPRDSILDAVRAINDGGRAIAFVCDPDGKVLGTLTDGDIRRALLAGSGLDARCLASIMNSHFAAVTPAAGRAEVLDAMRAREIEQVPVVDARGRLLALHSLHDLIGVAGRPNWAVVMAGGRGVRLRPLTDTVPKPMIRVAGRPILERLVLHLVSHGITRIFVAVNHLGDVIERHFEDGSRFGCDISYLRESKPLGTGGALSLLPSRPAPPILVVNGDLVTQFDVARMLRFHTRGQYAVTFGLRPHAIAIPYGVGRMRGNRLVQLREKPTERMLINAGIYIVGRKALSLIPKDCEYPLTGLFEDCQRRGLKVGATVIEDEWIDVGQHEDLHRARGDA